MKRIVFFLCTLLCANVLLAQSFFTIGDLTYHVISPTKVEVMKCDTSATSVAIPETVIHEEITYTVHKIGDYQIVSEGGITTYYGAFQFCKNLTSITIPNSIVSIGDCAFYGCENLTSITIPNGVESIGQHAFLRCNNLTTVTIPNSVKYILHYAFGECNNLTAVEIPAGVIRICEGAFAKCSNLTTVIIPNSVEIIEESAFQECISLQNVTCLATTPPELSGNMIFPFPNTAILTIPCGTFSAYDDQRNNWEYFFEDRIVEKCDNTNLEDVEFENLSFFPNPTNSKVTFSQAIEKVEVIDLSGKTLQTYENANEINIEALPAGVYHLRLTIEDKTTTRKVITE